MDIRNFIYLIGVIVFALFYGPIKSATGGGASFIVVAVCYLVALRFLGYGMSKGLAVLRAGRGR